MPGLTSGRKEPLLGRTFDGQGQPADGGPPIVPEAFRDITGAPLNPVARSHPSEFVETGISAIDGLATLVPGDSGGDGFVVVFAALGVTRREAGFYRDAFAAGGRRERMVLFVNLADDPAIERLQTPGWHSPPPSTWPGTPACTCSSC